MPEGGYEITLRRCLEEFQYLIFELGELVAFGFKVDDDIFLVGAKAIAELKEECRFS